MASASFLPPLTSLPDKVDLATYLFNIPAFSRGIDLAFRSRVTITRGFLNAPERFFTHLFETPEDPPRSGRDEDADASRLSLHQCGTMRLRPCHVPCSASARKRRVVNSWWKSFRSRSTIAAACRPAPGMELWPRTMSSISL